MRPTPPSTAHRSRRLRVLVVSFAAITIAASAFFAPPASASAVFTIYTGNAADDRIDVLNGDDGTPIGSFGTGLGGPSGVKLGPDGKVYAARTGSNSIGVFMQDGTSVQTILPGGPFLGASDLDFAPDGSFFVVYSTSNHVVRYVLPGIVVGVWNTGSGTFPHRITVAPSGSQVYVSLKGTDRVGVYNLAGAFLQFIGTPGSGPGQLLDPAGVAFHPNDGTLYIVESGNNPVQRFTPTGSPLNQWPSTGSPSGIEVAGGRIWIANSLNNTVSSFDLNGTPLGTVPANSPTDIAVKFAPATPPSFTSTPPTTGTVGVQYTYDPVVSGTSPMTFTLVSGPTGMTIDTDDGQVRWTPNVPGNFPVLLGVENAAGTATQNWTITVNPATGNGTIDAFAHTDVDGDGVVGAGDPPLNGVVVYLDLNVNSVHDAGEPAGPTDVTGRFPFTALADGTYYVGVSGFPNPDYVLTTANAPVVVLDQATPTGSVSFGAFERGRASGTVFNDLNGNGTRDAGEPGLVGWTVFVDQDTNGSPGPGEPQTTTDADGNYQLTGLGAGVAELVAQTQTGWDATGPTVIPLAATSGFNLIQHFGFEPRPAEIRGTKYEDVDGDEALDLGELGLEGRKLYLDLNGNDQLDSDEPNSTSGTDGSFAIGSLLPGSYELKEVAQSGWKPLAARSVTLGPGATATVDLPNFKLGTVQGTVFEDLNGNGTLDPGEPGLFDVVVFVDQNTNGAPDAGEPQTRTDENGSFQITGITAGHAELVVEILEGYQPTGPTVIPLDVTSGFHPTHNIGFELPRTEIQGTKFDDLDGDLARDEGEPGLPGWQVYLDLNGNDQLDGGEPNATSGSEGGFTIGDLPPGSYELKEVAQPGWGPLPSRTISLVFGETTTVLMPNFELGVVQGIVFNDLNGNGVLDPGEPGLPGRTVFIDLDTDGAPDADEPKTTTDADGRYEITGLTAGQAELVAQTQEGDQPTGSTVIPIDVTSGFTLTRSFGFTVPAPDLTATKSNNAGANAIVGTTFTWDIRVANVGEAPAAFGSGTKLLHDDLPSAEGPVIGSVPFRYGTPTVINADGVTGEIECVILGLRIFELSCTAKGNVTISELGGFDVVFGATPLEAGTFRNPADDGHSDCAADPDDAVGESDEENNECSDTVTAAVVTADLTALKANDAGGSVALGGGWTWSIKVSNVGDAPATFSLMQDILVDDLPSEIADYGTPTVTASTGVTGLIECSLVPAFLDFPPMLRCRANSPEVTIDFDGGFTVEFTARPSEVGRFTNPPDDGHSVCEVDPDDVVDEGEEGEGNNECNPDAVEVTAPDLSSFKSNDVAGLAILGESWTWSIRVDNIGDEPAVFEDGAPLLRDDLPSRDISYSITRVTGPADLECGIVVSTLFCGGVGGAVTLGPGGSIFVDLLATPSAVGVYENPTGGVCKADPEGAIREDEENNNDCENSVVVVAPELTATKSNDVNGVATGGGFRWTIRLANTSTSVDAAFDDTELILRDNLPAGASYGTPTVTNLSSVTGIGRITCQIVALELTCTASGGNVIIGPTIGALDVVIPVVPTTTGTLENPSNGVCRVDPDNKLAEGNELNNDCADTVRVEAAGQPIVELGPDATDPTKTELRITGTPANDLIDVRGRNAAVDVSINSVPFGRFSPTGRIVITGLAGNDSIFVGGIVFSRRAWVDGGAGDDTITTGNGPSLLLGGDGNDRLQSGSARDLLIGGTGADQLFGQNGDDILIAGTTSFDADTAALNAILAEWTSTRTYVQRINNLTGAGPGGANGSVFLRPGTTVQGDTSADTLIGGRATDWFFASPNDTTDARPFETITQL